MGYGLPVEDIFRIQYHSTLRRVIFFTRRYFIIIFFFQLFNQLIIFFLPFLVSFLLHDFDGVGSLLFLLIKVLLHCYGGVVDLDEKYSSHAKTSYHQQHEGALR